MAKRTEPGSTSKKKTNTGKSPSAGKQPVKEAKKKGGQRDRLEKELKDLLGGIDEEGLLFLLKQANVIIHNMQIDKLNREIVEYETKKRGSASKKKKPAGKTSGSGSASIEELPNKKSFFITMNNVRKIYSLDEMRSLVSICHASDSAGEASERLYRWLRQNRGDVFTDGSLKGPADPALEVLYKLIIKSYKVRS